MNIVIENLSKRFDDGTMALNGIDLDIGEGLFCLLGPNASGKTTLMRILATLSKPSGGRVLIDGVDLQKNRAKIRSITGYLPQSFSSFAKITTAEFLDYTARLAGLRNSIRRKSAVEEMLDTLGLYEVRDKNANELTVSMKRHLEIAQAVIGDPRILIVDEPTSGLSPEERLRFKKLLADKIGAIGIMILSTHILGDITSTCTNMAVLNRGEVVFRGAPETLYEQARLIAPLPETPVSEADNARAMFAVIDSVTNSSADPSAG